MRLPCQLPQTSPSLSSWWENPRASSTEMISSLLSGSRWPSSPAGESPGSAGVDMAGPLIGGRAAGSAERGPGQSRPRISVTVRLKGEHASQGYGDGHGGPYSSGEPGPRRVDHARRRVDARPKTARPAAAPQDGAPAAEPASQHGRRRRDRAGT